VRGAGVPTAPLAMPMCISQFKVTKLQYIWTADTAAEQNCFVHSLQTWSFAPWCWCACDNWD